MTREISTTRRKLDLVDMFVNTNPVAASYNFQKASNFDAAFASFQIVPAVGFRSVSAPESLYNESQFRGKTRFYFRPSDYSIIDSNYLWVRTIRTDVDGTVQPAGSIHLILPPYTNGRYPVVLNGSAPNGATVANSLELNLQQQCVGATIQNDGGADLFVAFNVTGPEFKVTPFSTSFTDYSFNIPSFSQIFVRGSGAAVAFTLTTSLRNESLS